MVPRGCQSYLYDSFKYLLDVLFQLSLVLFLYGERYVGLLDYLQSMRQDDFSSNFMLQIINWVLCPFMTITLVVYIWSWSSFITCSFFGDSCWTLGNCNVYWLKIACPMIILLPRLSQLPIQLKVMVKKKHAWRCRKKGIWARSK